MIVDEMNMTDRAAAVMLYISTNLLKQLQAVCVVIISKVDDSSLTTVGVKCLPQPPQGQIPLHGPSRYSGVPSVTPQLIVPGCLYIEVGVVQPCFSKEPRNKSCSPLWVLHQDPVQVGNMEEGVRQPRQLRFLHRPTVCRGDDVDSRQHIGPGWRPCIHIFCPYHLHYVLIWGTVFFGVLPLATCLPLPLDSVICRFGDKSICKVLVQTCAALCIFASGDLNPMGVKCTWETVVADCKPLWNDKDLFY